MIEIFLDDQRAIPTEGSKIKLTLQNVYFTKSSSYTYDVEFPLAIKQNRLIFGNLDRIDTPKESALFAARVIVDARPVIVGEAHITSVTDTSVKVQILGESAAYNYSNTVNDLYIDELDLGDWYSTTWPDMSYWDTASQTWKSYSSVEDLKASWGKYYFTHQMYWRAFDNYDRGTKDGCDHWNENVFGRSASYPWVALPIVNSTNEKIFNDYQFWLFPEGNEEGEEPEFTRTLNHTGTTLRAPFAIQPYLWIMAEKVAAATGLTLAREDNCLYTNDLFSKVIIANCNRFLFCNMCLPHWKVNDFWTQIENAFGCVVSIDYATNSMKLIHRYSFFTAEQPKVALEKVIDEFSADINDEETSDISDSNITFDVDDLNAVDRLSDFIMENAEIDTSFSYAGALLAFALMKGDDWMNTNCKNKIYLLKDDRQYIWAPSSPGVPYKKVTYYDPESLTDVELSTAGLTGRFVQVNAFRDQINNPNNDKTDISLKIVPAAYTDIDVQVSGYNMNAYNSTNIVKMRALTAPGIDVDTLDEEINIDGILFGEVEEEKTEDSKPDKIYIALALRGSTADYQNVIMFNGGNSSEPWLHYCQGWLRDQRLYRCNPTEPPYALSLQTMTGTKSIGSEIGQNPVTIKTSVPHCFKFISDTIPAVDSVFVIRGRLFVCDKLEASADANGLDKLITGYFYEIVFV